MTPPVRISGRVGVCRKARTRGQKKNKLAKKYLGGYCVGVDGSVVAPRLLDRPYFRSTANDNFNR